MAAPPPPTDRVRLAVVGTGPRGIGILAALLDYSEASKNDSARLHITVIDPFSGGGGPVWQPNQPAVLLANSMAGQISMFEPDPTNGWKMDFHSWCHSKPNSVPHGELTAEAQSLSPSDFASRRLVGAYIQYCYQEVIARLSRFHEVIELRGVLRGLDPRGSMVELDVGRHGKQHVEGVVLALGNPALGKINVVPSRTVDQFQQDRSGPAQAVDLRIEQIAAGERVLVSGLGLTFIDIVALLTEGRGGRYSDDGHGKRIYHPSGEEPLILAASRRGTLPLPKPAVSAGAGNRPSLYRVNSAQAVELLSGPRLTSRSTAERVMALMESELQSQGLGEFPIRELNGPLQVDSARTLQVHDVVLGSIRRNCALKNASDVHVLLASAIDVIAAPALAAKSEQSENAREILDALAAKSARFTSGPPAFRLEQLQALAEVGVLRFLGSGAVPESAGPQLRLRTGQFPDGVVGHHLIHARVPTPHAHHLPQVPGAQSWPLDSTGKVCIDPDNFTVRWNANGQEDEGRVVLAGAMANVGALGSLPRAESDSGFFLQNRRIVRALYARMTIDAQNA